MLEQFSAQTCMALAKNAAECCAHPTPPMCTSIFPFSNFFCPTMQLIAVHFCSCITNQLRYLVFYMDTSDVCTMLSVIWKVSFIFSLNPMWLRILMEVDIIRLLHIVYIFYLVFLAPSDRKSTRLNSSHPSRSRMPSSA